MGKKRTVEGLVTGKNKVNDAYDKKKSGFRYHFRYRILCALACMCAVSAFALLPYIVRAASGASITSPNNNSKYEVGSTVEIKAKADYVQVGSILSPKSNYIYFKVTYNGEVILYGSETFTSRFISLNPLAKSFKPQNEGEYLVEVCHDATYDGNTHVDLSVDDWPLSGPFFFLWPSLRLLNLDCHTLKKLGP